MNYTKQKLEEYFEWDVVNWSKALTLWDSYITKEGLSCLEIGGRAGGLSLYLAEKNNKVICSDMVNPGLQASVLHKKNPKAYSNIRYEKIDALAIPYENKFDIIIFKSVLCGLGAKSNFEKQKLMILQIYKALKKDGILLFAENLKGSKIHNFFRKRFVNWKNYWRYVDLSEIEELFKDYSFVKYETCGFLGVFGRTNKQRDFLAKFDTGIFDKILKPKSHYLFYGVAKK